MPSFSVGLGDENIWRVVTYLRSATRRDVEKATGEAASGEKLFWGKGGCGQCHRVGSRGGRMGPDLTRIGRTRSLHYLRESVISPNADLTPGYATITVVTRDGKKIAGVQRGYDNFSAQLMDSEENYYSFLKSDVTSITREFRSLMPDGYGKLFSASEVDDMVAYMSRLRSREMKRWLIVFAACAIATAATITEERLRTAQSDSAAWLMYGKNYAAWRYSELSADQHGERLEA